MPSESQSWFDHHPYLTLALLLTGAALLLWLLFFLFGRRDETPLAPQPSAPGILVSSWTPLP